LFLLTKTFLTLPSADELVKPLDGQFVCCKVFTFNGDPTPMKISLSELKQLIKEQIEEIGQQSPRAKRPPRPGPESIWNQSWGRWYGDGSEPAYTPEEVASNFAKDIKEHLMLVVHSREQSAGMVPHRKLADIILKVARNVASEVAARPDKED